MRMEPDTISLAEARRRELETDHNPTYKLYSNLSDRQLLRLTNIRLDSLNTKIDNIVFWQKLVVTGLFMTSVTILVIASKVLN